MEVKFTKVHPAPVVRVTSVGITRVEAEVDEESGEVWLVAYNRAGTELGRQVAIEALNEYHNKEN